MFDGLLRVESRRSNSPNDDAAGSITARHSMLAHVNRGLGILEFSLRPQRLDRIEARCAPGGQDAGG